MRHTKYLRVANEIVALHGVVDMRLAGLRHHVAQKLRRVAQSLRCA